MIRLMTLEVGLMFCPQLLVKPWKTQPLPRFQAVLMAEIPVVAQPLLILSSMLHCDSLLTQQGVVGPTQFGGEGKHVRPPRLDIL